MCVLGGTAVHGAGQQLRMRGAYVETAVATPLPHMTQLPAKTTHWAFPYCPSSFAFPYSLASVNTSCQSVFFLYTSLFTVLKSPAYYKLEPPSDVLTTVWDGRWAMHVFVCGLCEYKFNSEGGLSVHPQKSSWHKNTNCQALVWKNYSLKLFLITK